MSVPGEGGGGALFTMDYTGSPQGLSKYLEQTHLMASNYFKGLLK